jgi:flavorubredoxin
MKIIQAYDRWSKQETVNKAVVAYGSMWHSTETMAKAVADGLIDEGMSVKIMNLAVDHRSDVMTEVLDAKVVAIGSATLNNGMLPWVADVLQYMRGLKPAGKVAAAFGSYGWSGEAVKEITAKLEEMKLNVVEPGVRWQYVPDHEALKLCRELGQKLGQAAKAG